MRRTMRVLATLSILTSSMLFAHTASAIGTLYSSSTGTGDVACTTSGWISIYNYEVYKDSNNCYGTANIPSGVWLIRDGAFSGSPLSSITIPNTVTTIGDSAFYNSQLISITIPNSVTSISQRTFEHAHALTSVYIPSSVLSIGYGAFWAATSLTSITIPDSVISIGPSAFQDMLALESVVIGNGVTTISGLAFSDLPRLTSLVIGNSVSSIGNYSFAGPNLLTSVNLPNSLTTLGVNSFSERENSSSANASLLSFRFCGTGVNASALTSAGLGDKTRLACPAVITAGSEPNSQVVTFPAGVKVAEIPASRSLPAIKLDFASTAPEAVTVIPTTNSAPLSATPFMTSGSTRIVDIRIANHDGSDVTVCLEGASTDRLYHYTSGAWVELGGRSYVNGQVCGVTNSFSPFTAAPAKPITTSSSAAEAAAAIAAAAKREAEKRDARAEILRRYKGSEAVTVETYQKAEIAGITASNVNEFNKEILRLPIEQRGDLAEICKVARKYEVVGLIGSDSVKSVYPSQYIEIGLISADSKIKSTLVKAVSNLADIQRSSYEAIKAAINAKTAELQARKDRLAKVLARSSTRTGK